MAVFIPDIYCRSVCEITGEMLEKLNVEFLLIDIDNTLTEHNSQRIPQEILLWINRMHASGIKMMLFSNNDKERVAPYAAKINLPYFCGALKPFRKYTLQAISKLKADSKKTGIVGDQIFTDMLAGKIGRIKTILVDPVSANESFLIQFKRKLETPIRRIIRRNFTDRI